MTDKNSQFFAILTALGEAKQANANALGIPWTFASMGVGDAGGTEPIPNRLQTGLINQRHWAPLNQVKVDPNNPSIIIAEQVIPPDIGGWWIREIALYDADGTFVAVANCAPSYKPELAQGTGKTQVVRLHLVVTSTANIQLKIDPSVVLATREYVDTSILNVLPPNKQAGTYTQVRIDQRGVVQQGYNPTTLAGYGIVDAYTRQGTDGLVDGAVARLRGGVGEGYDTLQKIALDLVKKADTQVIVDLLGGVGAGYNTLQKIALDLVKKADMAGATFTGPVRVPNVLAGNVSDQAANTKFVADAIAALVASSPAALDTLNELAAALGNDPNFATTMTNALSGKAAKAATLGGYGIADALTKTETTSLVDGAVTRLRGGVGEGYDTLQKIALDLVKKADSQRIADLLGGVGSGYDTLQKIALDLVKKADMAGATFTGPVRVPNVLAGNVSDQAANTKFVADAIAALVASSPAALDTLNELAAALGNDPNFAATMTNLLANKFDKAGGTVSGQTTISTTAQSETQSGLVVQNPADIADAWAVMVLSGRYGAVSLKYRVALNTLYFRNYVTDFTHIDAGNVYSNSHPCHTDVSFMMPNVSQWFTLDGERTLPAGGTWAYYVSAHTSGGVQKAPKATVVPGGTVIGGVGGVGFVWRIF